MTSQYSAKRLWLCFLCLATTYIHFSQPACCKHLQGQHSHSCYPAAQAAINITLWPALHSDASITMKCTPGSETAVSEGMYVFTCNSCQIASLSKHKNKNKKIDHLHFYSWCMSKNSHHCPIPVISDISVLLNFAFSKLAVKLNIFLYVYQSIWICFSVFLFGFVLFVHLDVFLFLLD